MRSAKLVMAVVIMVLTGIVGGIVGSVVVQLSEEHEEYVEWCEDNGGEMVDVTELEDASHKFRQCQHDNGTVTEFKEWRER